MMAVAWQALLAVPAQIAIGLMRIYRAAISPLLGHNCRFEPSCACYGEAAFRRHGAWRGGWLTLLRLLRCHPWGGMGYDPVPDRPQPRAPIHPTGLSQ